MVALKLRLFPLKAVCLSDTFVGEGTGMGVDASDEFGMAGTGTYEAFRGEELDVREGDVGEGLGRGAGKGAGHVGNAVVGHTFFDVDGILVRGGVSRLDTAALIDGNVHDDCALLHGCNHFAAHEARCFGARDEDRTDEEVGAGEKVDEGGFAGVKRVCPGHGGIEELHALGVDLENGRLGADPGGDSRRVHATGSAPNDDDATGENSGNASEKSAATAFVYREKIGADHDGHAAGDFAHRFEQGRAVTDLNRLISDGTGTRGDEIFGELLVGCEV